LHYGDQKFSGSTLGVDNDSFASYKDWKVGVTYTLPKDFTLGAFYTTPAQPNGGSRFLGKDTFTVFIQKTF